MRKACGQTGSQILFMTQFTCQEITQELDKENQNQNQESCQNGN